MMRKLVGLAAGLALCTTLLAADATKPGKPTVEAVALSIYKKIDDKNLSFGFPSSSLSLLVTYPGKQFLDIDSSASKVSEFKDDKGNSLMYTGFATTNFNRSQIGKDKSAMVVTMGGNPPGRGATRLHLKGNLVARCGLEEKTTDEKEVELKLNAETKIGDYTLKVTQEKGLFGSGATFTVTTPSPALKTVTVKDADGKTIEVLAGGHYGFGKNWSYYFSLKKEAKKVKIAVVYFSKEEKVDVPVDIDVGVGL
jgi:hypothetical protein